ncbi:MAG: PilZ domain-containing protein [Candidatus Omnitrophica bacterium]|nr:PilZ domain-containing protein [Candidatus Omnitrophota bacterium]
MTTYKGSEKRKHARMSANFVINYQIQELSYSYDLSQTKNVSQGGVLLTTNKSFDKGEQLTINLRIPFVVKKIKLKGEVIDSREVVRNLTYETRVKFLNLDKDFFNKLGEFIEENLK